MRFISIIVALIASCSPMKQGKVLDIIDPNGIVYVLPGNVQKSLLERTMNEKTYFVLTKTDDLNFRIYVQQFEKESNWIKNTNRYLSVAGNLYPLLFDLDNFFANSETAIEFMENHKNGIYKRTIVTVTRDFVYHIDFNIHGDILYEGL